LEEELAGVQKQRDELNGKLTTVQQAAEESKRRSAELENRLRESNGEAERAKGGTGTPGVRVGRAIEGSQSGSREGGSRLPGRSPAEQTIRSGMGRPAETERRNSTASWRWRNKPWEKSRRVAKDLKHDCEPAAGVRGTQRQPGD